jgi:hypothetical protein
MLAYLRNASTPIWMLLILATGLSWWLGHGPEAADSRPYAATGLVIIAAIKIRLVVRCFMEVHNAPLVLQRVMDAWLLAMCAGILGTYWFGIA